MSDVVQKDGITGSFEVIDGFQECEAQVLRAVQTIVRLAGSECPDMFAYPFGESSQTIRETYFPGFIDRHHILAAFGTEPHYLTRQSDRWNLSRFIHGCHGNTPEQFNALLDGQWVMPTAE